MLVCLHRAKGSSRSIICERARGRGRGGRFRFFQNFLNKKKIALVGPASSIEKDKNGEFIDSHDIVVRLNYAKIKNPDHSGTKTDVIYYDGSLHDYENLNLDGNVPP